MAYPAANREGSPVREADPIYQCPLCEGGATPWRLYPALGSPICDACDEALLDDPWTIEAACRLFAVSPSLLAQIVERQRPWQFTSDALARRLARTTQPEG